MAKLIVGCGYLGYRVAQRWRAAGDEVLVVTRDATRAARFAAEGFRPIVADVLRPESLAGLRAVDVVLYAVGYDRTSGVSIEDAYPRGLKNVLDALPASIGKLIYVSSTGVYGQATGETVDEDSPCEPTRPGGRAALAAEHVLAAHPLGNRGIVLRLAGIYGPERIPLAADIRASRPLAVPADGHLNLIHVDDAAAVVVAAAERAVPPRTYVVSDGHPVERRAYYEELARLIGAPEPTFAAAAPGSPATDRAGTDKRMTNARLLAELPIQLAYPSYREGLAALVGGAGN